LSDRFVTFVSIFHAGIIAVPFRLCYAFSSFSFKLPR